MPKWWIEEDLVAGGRHPGPEEIEQLSREGFTLVISLLEEGARPPRYDPQDLAKLGMRRVNLPVPDFSAPTLEQMREFIRLVREESIRGRVYVHCESGQGRTGTMAAAWWIQKGLSPAEAIARVRQAKPAAVETREQEEQLKEFHRDL